MPSFYHYLWLFLAFGVFGWFIETCIVSFQQKKFVNRGFLTGPMCPIYGVGICLVVLALSPLPKTWWILFFGGGLIATGVEYFVGWLLEKIFNQRWWDYSDHRFNLNGRIALPESLAWSPLAMVAMLYFVPWFSGVIDRIPRSIGWTIFAVIIVLTVLDIIAILKSMNSLTKMAEAVREQAERLRERLEENTDALREAVEESVRFAVEARLTKWQARREKFDMFLDKRLKGAFPKLSERWRVDDDDDEE